MSTLAPPTAGGGVSVNPKYKKKVQMIPELGNFSLMLALCLALVQSVFPIAGSFRANARWMALAKPAAAGQFLFVAVSFASWCIHLSPTILGDLCRAEFESLLPATTELPAPGAATKVHCCWILMLTVWTLRQYIQRPIARRNQARVIGVMGLISIGSCASCCFTSNRSTAHCRRRRKARISTPCCKTSA